MKVLFILAVLVSWDACASVEEDVIANIEKGNYLSALELQRAAPITKSSKGQNHKRARQLNDEALGYSKDNDLVTAVNTALFRIEWKVLHAGSGRRNGFAGKLVSLPVVRKMMLVRFLRDLNPLALTIAA